MIVLARIERNERLHRIIVCCNLVFCVFCHAEQRITFLDIGVSDTGIDGDRTVGGGDRFGIIACIELGLGQSGEDIGIGRVFVRNFAHFGQQFGRHLVVDPALGADDQRHGLGMSLAQLADRDRAGLERVGGVSYGQHPSTREIGVEVVVQLVEVAKGFLASRERILTFA